MAGAPRFRIWPPVAYAVPFAVGIAITSWLGDPVTYPPWTRWAGWGFAALVVPWDLWAIRSLQRHHAALLPGPPTTSLVTTGPFHLSRNPLYVGFTVLHAGVALALGSTWALAGLPVAMLAVLWGAILPEEAYLQEKFGPVYKDYRVRVRRWL